MKTRDFKPIQLDMIKSDTEKDWKNAIREEISRYRAARSKATKKHGLPADNELELDGAMEKRRVKALMNSLPEICEKYPKAVNDWVVLNIVSESYAVVENNNLMLAAAIWILDQLDKLDLPRQELYKLLPTSDEEFDYLDYPDIWDSRFEDTLIYSVESVLRNRNKDVTSKERDSKDAERIWTSTLAAKGSIPSDSKSRQRFESLIGLIPQEQIYVAVQHFKYFFNLWQKRFFACIEPLCDEAESIRENANEIRRKINDEEKRAADVVKRAESERKNLLSRQKNPLQAPFVPPINDFSSHLNMDSHRVLHNPFSDMIPDDVMSLLSKLDELNDLHEEAIDAYNSAMGKKFSFCATLNRHGFFSKQYCEKAFGKAASNQMELLPITDPYELCFGLLYLLEQDNDIPWLYGACTGFMEEVSSCLPWGYFHYEEEDDDIWSDETIMLKKPISIPDWYERIYYNKDTDDDFEYPHNLTQVIYEETGCLMPRDLHKYDSKYKYLGKFGIQRSNAIALLYCMDIMGNARRQLPALNLDESYMEFMSKEGNNNDGNDDEMSNTELKQRVSAQAGEIQRLRSALYAAEKKVADSQKKLSEEKKEFELERQELAELREYIFLQNQASEPEDDEPDTSVFPYVVKKDTVVFGGHFTWLKAFKPLIKGEIRYVEAGAAFDSGIIKNCDVVWIQNNAIPHSQYYKVINNARQYRKPVRYFRYASAVKCANQLIESDNEE